jgi:hypothetical protein
LTHIDTREIEANIEHTRFPVPEHEQHTSTADYPGLLRALAHFGRSAMSQLSPLSAPERTWIILKIVDVGCP